MRYRILVVRGGKLKTVVQCPPGYRSADGRCVRMSSMEIIKLAKRARKAALTRHRHAGSIAKHSMKSLKLSDRIRDKNASRIARVKYV